MANDTTEDSVGILDIIGGDFALVVGYTQGAKTVAATGQGRLGQFYLVDPDNMLDPSGYTAFTSVSKFTPGRPLNGVVGTFNLDDFLEAEQAGEVGFGRAWRTPWTLTFLNLRTGVGEPNDNPNEISLNFGMAINASAGLASVLDTIGKLKPNLPLPPSMVAGLLLEIAKRAVVLSQEVAVGWLGFGIRIDVTYDDAGNFVTAMIDGVEFDLGGLIDSVEDLTAGFGLENAAGIEEIASAEGTPTLDAMVVDASQPFEYRVEVPSGVVVSNQDATWYQNDDGTNVTQWYDEGGANLAITYPDGSVFIESSDGIQTFYDPEGEVVRLPSGTPPPGGLTRNEEFEAWLDSVDVGDLDAPVPGFTKAFPLANDTILLGLYGEGSTAQISTVMTSDGLAKVVSLDGEAQYIVYGDGRVENLQSLTDAVADPAAGENLDGLADIIDASEVLFEAFRKDQAVQSALQTWEAQYKAPIDAFIEQLLDPRNAILFDDERGIPGLGESLMTAIEAYRAGDGAFRFVANIIGLADSNLGSNGTLDGAVDGLITLLNTDNDLSNEDKESFSGVLLASAFAFQAVRGAQQAISPGGDLSTRLGFANDTVLALGSLAALGVIHEDFAKVAALSYAGVAAFAVVRETFDTSRQNAQDIEAYKEAVGSAVSLISTLGRMGVINEEVTNAVLGTYNTYKVVETGLEIYENWGVDTPQVMESIGGFLTALGVLAQVGWLSDDAAKAVNDATQAYNVINSGYTLATQGFSLANSANFALAMATVLVDEDDLDGQLVVAGINMIASIATANPVAFFASALSFFSILSLRDEQKRAEEEARRIQIADILDEVDVDGNGVSIDGVKYEYNINDDYIYLLGEPEIAVSKANWQMFRVTESVLFGLMSDNADYYYYDIPSGRRVDVAEDYNRVPYYILKVEREFDAPVMGAYANSDIRIIEYYYPDLPGATTGLRNQLEAARRTQVELRVLTEEEYQEALAALGGDTGESDVNTANSTFLDTVAPISPEVRIAYVQSNENLGLTTFRNINDDDGDGFVGRAYVPFSPEDGRVNPEDFGLLAENEVTISLEGDFTQLYFEITRRYTPETNDIKWSQSADGKVIMIYNPYLKPTDELYQKFAFYTSEGYFVSAIDSQFPVANGGSGGWQARRAAILSDLQIVLDFLNDYQDGVTPVTDKLYGLASNNDILDKVTTFAGLDGQTQGDGSTLIQLLNDKGQTYLAFALSSDAMTPGAEGNTDLVETARLTQAARALNPWRQIDPETSSLNLKPENRVDSPTLNRDYLSIYRDLIASGTDGDKWILSDDGRLVTIYVNGNIGDYLADTTGFDPEVPVLLVFDADGILQRHIENPFSTVDFDLLESGQEGGLFSGFDLHRILLRETLNIANSTSAESPSVDIQLLGFDTTGLEMGEVNFGGIKVLGIKDYSQAPMADPEKMVYLSYIASRMAQDPMSANEMGVDMSDVDNMDAAAIAARVYVAKNTPRNEFYANNELPTNVFFDPQAFLKANPEILIKLSNSMTLGIDAKAVFDSLSDNTLTQEDFPKVFQLFQLAAFEYSNAVLNGRDVMFGAFAADLNGDVRRDEAGNIVSGGVDIVRVDQDGLGVATISVEGADPSVPNVSDFVVKHGKLLGIRADVDGDGIIDNIYAPDADGGIWRAELSSGVVAEGRTAEAAQRLALAGDALQPGGGGISVDVNGDGIADLAQVLANGSGQVTMGFADAAAPGGVSLSTTFYTGETLQDAVANANSLQLLAWVGGDDQLIAAIGNDVSAAQVAFSRNPSYAGSLDLGQFALENRALIEQHGMDLAAALSSYIGTRQTEIRNGRLADATAQLTYASELRDVLVTNYDAYLQNGYEYNGGLETTLIVNALSIYDSRVGRLEYPLETLAYDALNEKAKELDGIFHYNSLGRIVPLEERAALEKEFVEGPLSEAVRLAELDVMRIESRLVDFQRFADGDMDFTFDYSFSVADRVGEMAGGMMDALAAGETGGQVEHALEDTPESFELKSAMYQRLGFDVGTQGDDEFRADYEFAARYDGYGGNDKIYGSGLDDLLVGGNGDDRLSGLLGNDVLYGGNGRDSIYGSVGDDLIFGEAQKDYISGGTGNDILIGGKGDDSIFGSAGTDILIGGAGDDYLVGGGLYDWQNADADTYVYGQGGGQDLINGFNPANGDVIAFDIPGMTDFATLMTFASEVGEDADNDFGTGFSLPTDRVNTVFDFGNGDTVTLEVLHMSSLTAANFVFDHSAVNAAIAARLAAATAPAANRDPNVADDVGFVVENGSVLTLASADILSNDGDPDGDDLTVTSVQNAVNGTVSLAASGQILFTPDPGYEGPAFFEYTVSDGRGGVASSIVSLTVNPVPTPDPAIVDGGAGDDVLVANVAGSVVNGFSGADTLVGDAGDDTLNGGSENDRLFGNDGADVLNGDAGNDSLFGRQGNDTLRGGTGDDLLYGGDGADSLSGEAGDDSLYGDAGNDQLAGGAGNDDVIGGDGDDTLLGGIGDDLVYGGAGQDYIDGGDGADRLFGFAGDDEIHGGAGQDIISGDGGLDRLSGDAGNDTIIGGAGNDLLYGGADDDDLSGGAGDDLLEGGTGMDVLNGEEGDDTIYAGAGDDRLIGGGGADLLHGDDGIDTAVYQGVRTDYRIQRGELPNSYIITELADPANVDTLVNVENVVFDNISYDIEAVRNTAPEAVDDSGLVVRTGETLTLTAASLLDNDSDLDGDSLNLVSVQNAQNGTVMRDDAGVITFTPDAGFLGVATFDYTVSDGQGGTSVASVSIWVQGVPTDGADELYGADGADTILAGAGDDLVFGGDGDDWLYGEAGNDMVSGGAGMDMLYAGAGDDTLSGGAGNDRLYGNLGTNTLNGDDGDDAIYGGTGIDTLNGGAGDDWLYGGPGTGDDMLNGGDGDDTLFGREGDDVLNGGAGSDGLYGEYGNDTLSGGVGNDRLYGDAGNDTLSGGMGFDWLYGGVGDDVLNGDSGIDDLFGGLGNDVLSGGEDSDDLYGEGGDDILIGGGGADRLDGGDGADVAYYDGTLADYSVELGADAGSYVVTELADPTNVDTLSNVETLLFGNVHYAIESLFNAAPVAADDSGFTIQAGAVLTLTPGSILANDSDADGDVLSLLAVQNASGGTVALNAQGDVVFTPSAGFQGAASFGYTVSDGNGATADATVGLTVMAPVSAADDVILGGLGNDTISGGDGDDQITAGAGDDVLNGDAGIDTLYGGDGSDIVSGGLGNDYVYGDAGDDTVDGGAGNDWAYGGLGNDTITGGDGSDRLYGDAGDDTISGDGGVDRIYGGAGDDTMSGGDAIDYLYGGDGADTLKGDLGNDYLRGEDGDDLLLGGEGNDSLYGLNGNDTLVGGVGDDRLYGWNGTDILYGDAGADRLYGNDGNDTLNGGDGNDLLYGGDQDDIVNGGQGNDDLYGDSGNDVISGGAGWDDLYGLIGDDILDGGAANDALSGGVGNDTFVFVGAFGADRITDFTSGAGSEDVIDFSGLTSVNSFAEVLAASYQSGTSTVIDLAEGKVTLLNTDISQLAADDFNFV